MIKIHELHDLENPIMDMLIETFIKIDDIKILKNYHPEHRNYSGNLFNLLVQGRYSKGKGAYYVLEENKEFIKAEIIAYITANYPSVQYSRTICKRDTGFIVDAMIYDLTYGGFTQTLNAGLAYFDGTTGLEIDASEVAATVASYGRLKTVMQQIAANTTVTKSAGNAATQFTDATNLTGGSAASSFIGANIDNITNLLAGDSTAATPPIVTVTSITGTDTTDILAKYSAVQYKVFQDGHFIWVNRAATDSTKTAFQNTYGYGTFTFADGVSTEVPSTSSYASIVGMNIKVKITLTGKNEYTQEIVDEAAKTTSIEKYTRL